MQQWSQEWLKLFDDSILNGAWAANFVQALVSSVIAVMLGLFILRKQLASDRQIANSQAVEAARLARAARLSDAAAAVGRLLNQAANSDREQSNAELGESIRANGRPQDQAMLETARTEGLLHFEGFDDHPVFIATKERAYAWRVARQLLAEESWMSDIDVGHAYRLLTAPANGDLRAVATELIRWDGFGEVPSDAATVRSSFPVATDVAERRADWIRDFRSKFLAAAKRQHGGAI